VRLTSPGRDARLASSLHRWNQTPDCGKRCYSSFKACLFCKCSWLVCSFLNILIQNITEVLNGIEVLTFWWPWQCVNIVVVCVGNCQSCCVGSLAWILCQDLRSDMAVHGGQQSVAQHIAQMWHTTNSDDVNNIDYIMIWHLCAN